jgi:hypothetical protein
MYFSAFTSAAGRRVQVFLACFTKLILKSGFALDDTPQGIIFFPSTTVSTYPSIQGRCGRWVGDGRKPTVLQGVSLGETVVDT